MGRKRIGPSLEKPAPPTWAFVLFGAGALVTPADFPPSPIGLFEIAIEPEQK